MKKLTLLIVGLLCTILCGNMGYAQQFGVTAPGGQMLICRVLEGGTEVSVQRRGYDISGDLIIPSTVTNDGISYSVTTIPNQAFRFCSGLTSVTIPNSITTIGAGAFERCTGLTSITIPNPVTTIGEGAFSGCSGLTSITLPPSITRIERVVFSGCTNLTSLPSLNSVTYIGERAFSGCTGLTSLVIPNSVDTISRFAFSECINLKSITIGTSVAYIDEYAFRDCQDVDTVIWNARNATVKRFTEYLIPSTLVIGSSVNAIPDDFFCNCTSLTNLVIQDSVNTIGDNAFKGCTGLVSVNIPHSVVTIGDNAFNGCTGLASVNIPHSVVTIGDNAFNGCTGITSLNIPNSVRSIGHYAFRACTGIKTLSIGTSLDTIYSDVFAGCTHLDTLNYNALHAILVDSINRPITTTPWPTISTLNIGPGTRVIPNNAFNGCSNLIGLFISNSVKRINESAFRDCSSLSSINIPDSVTFVGLYAFMGCSNAKVLTIGTMVDTIYSASFNGCSNVDTLNYNAHCSSFFITSQPWLSISSLNIGQEVQAIPNRLFRGFRNLTSVVIPCSVLRIGDNAFRDCSGLTSVGLPNSLISIGRTAFLGCDGLRSVYVSDTCVTSISVSQYLLANPTIVAGIGDSAFLGIHGLVSVVMPDSLQTLGMLAFYGCDSLSSVVFPSGLKEMKGAVFGARRGYLPVYKFKSSPPPMVENSSWSAGNNELVIIVPCGTIELYKDAFQRKVSGNITSDCARNIYYFPNNYHRGGWVGHMIQYTFVEGDAPLIVDEIIESYRMHYRAIYYPLFLCWNTKPDGSGASFVPRDTMTSVGDTILYAIWGSYIEFNANGGTGSMDPIYLPDIFEFQDTNNLYYNYTITHDDAVIPDCGYYREGYRFVGWSGSYNGSIDYRPNDTLILSEYSWRRDIGYHIILYAVWERETFPIHFNANGGTGTMDDGVVASSVYIIPECAFRNGTHHFLRWNTQPDGTGTNYVPGRTVGIDDPITLYAIWSETITIHFDANGGTGTMADASVENDESYTIPSCGFTRQGYRFVNWNTAPNGSGDTRRVGASINPTANTTLYAIWESTGGGNPAGIETLAEAGISISTYGRSILVSGADGMPVTLYDIQGRPIETKHAVFGQTIRFDVPATGVYMLRVGNIKAQRVAVLR